MKHTFIDKKIIEFKYLESGNFFLYKDETVEEAYVKLNHDNVINCFNLTANSNFTTSKETLVFPIKIKNIDYVHE